MPGQSARRYARAAQEALSSTAAEGTAQVAASARSLRRMVGYGRRRRAGVREEISTQNELDNVRRCTAQKKHGERKGWGIEEKRRGIAVGKSRGQRRGAERVVAGSNGLIYHSSAARRVRVR